MAKTIYITEKQKKCLSAQAQVGGKVTDVFRLGGMFDGCTSAGAISETVTPNEVNLKSFKIKQSLNPTIWKDGSLDSRIRLKLLDIAEDFMSFIGVDWSLSKDIIMTGSLANYNWDKKYSDIDLHIILDFSDVDENTELVEKYFRAQKKVWSEEHSDLRIMGFPVEIYIQSEDEEHDSSGIYSLQRDKWVEEPDRETLVSSKINEDFIKERVSFYMNQIDRLCYRFKKSQTSDYKVRKISERAKKLFDEIKNKRKEGFEKSCGKEINNFNLIFKSLRRNGYLEKLVDLRSKSYDRLNSLN